jgi:hypothetical protein
MSSAFIPEGDLAVSKSGAFVILLAERCFFRKRFHFFGTDLFFVFDRFVFFRNRFAFFITTLPII